MRAGKIVQVDTPQRLYSEPRDVFVAGFIGSPAMNLVEATVHGGLVRFADLSIPLPPSAEVPEGEVILGIRPEDFEDSAHAPGLPTIEVGVEVLEELGSDAHIFFSVAARSITPQALEAGDDARGLVPASGALFTARVDARTTARIGGRIELAIDTQRLQFFDCETGLRLTAGRTAAAPAELTALR